MSAHRERFILKGAMLLVTWVADPFRPTRDLDLLGRGDSDAMAVGATFRDICSVAVVDDGVTFDAAGLAAAPIREDQEYGGVRVRTTATIAGARVSIQIDVGFGDVVTPAPVEIDYPVMLGNPAPRLKAYPVESVVAEKLHALATLGIANSRMKDFYDLWQINRTFELRASTLSEAVRRTFERRQTPIPVDPPIGLTDAFVVAKAAQWAAFLGRERMASAPADLASVIAGLRAFLLPLLGPAGDDTAVWSPGGPWSTSEAGTS